MDAGTGLQDSGRHLLGPHVIGQRVVVRRLVRGEVGPTGGPAFTDLLGVCTAWGDDRCVVQPERGEAVSIPIADIVSGKPVPPRPSVRHRVSPREAEAHVSALWPGVETVALGEWELRCDPAPAGRPLKRANSALAIGSPEMPVPDALAQVVAFYAARNREPLLHVLTGDAAAFPGWQPVPGGDSEFQLGSLSRASRALRPIHPFQVGLTTTGQSVTVELRVDEQVVASGEAALSGEWIGLHALIVDPALRRRGLARRVLAELLEWGAERGATTVWLHVEPDNTPALALYESIGLRTHHEMTYLAPDSS